MYELQVQSSILYRLLLRLRVRATATVQLGGKMQATVQTTDCWCSYTGYYVKIEPRILRMCGELFAYCRTLYRLLGAAAAACSLYSYSRGASFAKITQPQPRDETLLPDVGRGHGCYEYRSGSTCSIPGSIIVVAAAASAAAAQQQTFFQDIPTNSRSDNVIIFPVST